MIAHPKCCGNGLFYFFLIILIRDIMKQIKK